MLPLPVWNFHFSSPFITAFHPLIIIYHHPWQFLKLQDCRTTYPITRRHYQIVTCHYHKLLSSGFLFGRGHVLITSGISGAMLYPAELALQARSQSFQLCKASMFKDASRHGRCRLYKGLTMKPHFPGVCIAGNRALFRILVKQILSNRFFPCFVHVALFILAGMCRTIRLLLKCEGIVQRKK